MPVSNIIDNRDEKLVDHINLHLEPCDMVRFALAYFFLTARILTHLSIRTMSPR
ncbi:MAG: hypothetical protein IVW55_03955 [Chloroflexi bacterium]|nr:hypothetical protein [Chloroflexota bacterium]